MAIRSARIEDFAAIRELLTRADLPVADVSETSPITFFVFEDDEHLVTGCVGLGVHGTAGLLRSLAVNPVARNAGIGHTLLSNVEEAAALQRIEQLYLLTTTASDFFVRSGYEVADRGSAPKTIQGTSQFAELCPASATFMVKTLERR